MPDRILAAQRMLKLWYGVQHTPVLSAVARDMIALLEKAPAGAEFDKAFLRHMSHHHYEVLGPSLQCVVGVDLSHQQLQCYRQGIVDAQAMEIDEMRRLLCRAYSDCQYQPFGRHAERAMDTMVRQPGE